jgi:very-short-patch-repair endonuclease
MGEAKSIPPPDQGEVRRGLTARQADTSSGKQVHQVARMLRRNATAAEKKLWYRIRAGQLGGQFRRQFPIGDFIVDFCCRERRLVIELDGSQHGEAAGIAADEERTSLISARGYRVIRFWNDDILKNLDSVLEQIFAELSQPAPNLPPVTGSKTIPNC